MQIQRIHDVTLLADNLAELRAFYSALGFQEVFVQGEQLVVFAAGDNELALHFARERPKNAVTLSFRVRSAEAAVRHFKAAGIAYDGPRPLRPGLAGVSVKDPNGNVLEFLSPS